MYTAVLLIYFISAAVILLASLAFIARYDIRLQYEEYVSIIQNIRTKYKTKIFIKFKSISRNIVTRHGEDIVTEERMHLATHTWKLKTT